MLKELKVPDIGQYENVEIIEVPVKAGDSIQKEDPLITLETEKASMDVPSEYDGTLKELKVKVGDRVSKGSVIGVMEVTGDVKEETVTQAEKTEQKPAEVSEPAKSDTGSVSETTTDEEDDTPFTTGEVHAGPATRQLARELGIDLTKVKGTGRKGRIITADVKQFTKKIVQSGGGGSGLNIEPAPEVDFSQFGEIEVVPLTRIKKWTAKNMLRNWVTIPHVTQFEEADITEMEAFRQENKEDAKSRGVNLTPLPFIMKAVVSTLKIYPQFNASLAPNGEELVLKKYCHLGIAVDTPTGLMVPVIRNADSKGIFELAKELKELSDKAKAGTLKAAEMQGSCFSISSLGSVGGTAFTPIINAPDVAILGVSKAQIKPMYREHKLMPRLMLPFSLSYDHRVIDGVEAAKFVVTLAQQLQEIRKILL